MKIHSNIRLILLLAILFIGNTVGRCQIYKYIGLEDGLSNQKIYHIQKYQTFTKDPMKWISWEFHLILKIDQTLSFSNF